MQELSAAVCKQYRQHKWKLKSTPDLLYLHFFGTVSVMFVAFSWMCAAYGVACLIKSQPHLSAVPSNTQPHTSSGRDYSCMSLYVLLLTTITPVWYNCVCKWCHCVFSCLLCPSRCVSVLSRQPGGWWERAEQRADSPDPKRPVQGLPGHCRPLSSGIASGSQVCRKTQPHTEIAEIKTHTGILYAFLTYLIVLLPVEVTDGLRFFGRTILNAQSQR